jgi:class 3 adenylate cyclase
VNFSSIGEQMEPEELVSELDYCFREFDRISGDFGLERIKTIGDAYLCVGGLPGSEGDHTLRAVRAALAIRDFVAGHYARRQAENKPACTIRIGLHNGPVVAGVVGDRKFAYDIWGDTVNMAARMERNSEPGRVNVSGRTWAIVKNQFSGTFRGKIMAKNKGEVEMYFVDNEIVPWPLPRL